MSLSSYIWTTFSSIPTTFPNTKLTSRKYFAGSALMDCLLMQTNASSTSLPANISDTCCLLKASPWPLTKSKSSKIGRNPGKSKTSSLSSDSPTSIVVSFSDTLKSPFHLRVLPTRVPLGTSLMSSIQPLKHLKSFHHSSGPYPLDSGHSNYSRDQCFQICTRHCPFNYNIKW